jgi:hypothetical protein
MTSINFQFAPFFADRLPYICSVVKNDLFEVRMRCRPGPGGPPTAALMQCPVYFPIMDTALWRPKEPTGQPYWRPAAWLFAICIQHCRGPNASRWPGWGIPDAEARLRPKPPESVGAAPVDGPSVMVECPD